MKPYRPSKVSLVCEPLMEELDRLGTREADDLSAELLDLQCRVELIEEGECGGTELLEPLESGAAAMAQIVSRIGEECRALLARRGIKVTRKASLYDLSKSLDELDDCPRTRLRFAQALDYATELQEELEDHLVTVRLAASGRGQAMAQLEDVIARAQKYLKTHGRKQTR